MLTAFNFGEYVYHALEAGATGFMLRDASREQLADAVRSVAAGETLIVRPGNNTAASPMTP